MKRLLSFLILFSFVFFLSSSINAQGKYGVIGKSFTKGEANILFGKVMGSIQVAKSEVERALEKAGDYVLFAIKDSRVYILNEKKFSLTEKGFSLGKEEVGYLVSTEVVKGLLNRTNGKYLTFELRYNSPKVKDPKSGQYSTSAILSGEIIFTITGDSETIEQVWPCPPMCQD